MLPTPASRQLQIQLLLPLLQRTRLYLLAIVFHKRIETGVLIGEVSCLTDDVLQLIEIREPFFIADGEICRTILTSHISH